MNIKLKLHIKTPVGTARKIKISNDGELLFVAPGRTGARDRWGGYEVIDKEFSLCDVDIWVVEED